MAVSDVIIGFDLRAEDQKLAMHDEDEKESKFPPMIPAPELNGQWVTATSTGAL